MAVTAAAPGAAAVPVAAFPLITVPLLRMVSVPIQLSSLLTLPWSEEGLSIAEVEINQIVLYVHLLLILDFF